MQSERQSMDGHHGKPAAGTTNSAMNDQERRVFNSAVIADFTYAAIRAFVLAHEAAHVMVTAYDRNARIWVDETRADLAGIHFTKSIPIQSIVDPRVPITNDLATVLPSFDCHAGFKIFLEIIQSAGFSDVAETGDVMFGPQQRSEQLAALLRKNNDCEKH
jgi:hypothetical protein